MTLAITLVACGGSGQDGASDSSSRSIRGLGVDGYLARATVYVDLDSDGMRDAFEPMAFTDDNGYYSFNPLTQTDYCRPSASVEQQEFCLRVPSRLADVTLRVSGGYDLLTDEPFVGSLSRKVNISSLDDSHLTIISPLTSLVDDMTTTERAQTLASFEITEADLDRDYYNQAATQTNQVSDAATDQKLLSSALKIHKLVGVLTDSIESTYDGDNDDELNLGAQASAQVYAELGRQFVLATSANTVTTAASLLGNSALIESVANSAGKRIKNLIEAERKSTTVVEKSAVDMSRAIEFAKLGSVIDLSFADLPIDTIPTIDNSKSASKLIDLSVARLKTDSAAQNSALVSTLQDALARSQLLTEVGKESTSISALQDVDLSDINAVQAKTNRTIEPVFTDLANTRLVFGQDDVIAKQDFAAIIYFSTELAPQSNTLGLPGSAGFSSGTMQNKLVACVRYVDGLKADGSLRDGGTLGSFSEDGSWAIKKSGYGVLVNLSLAGATRSALVQYDGINDQDQHVYFTDLGDEFATWTGSNKPSSFTGIVPSSDAECQTALEQADPYILGNSLR